MSNDRITHDRISGRDIEDPTRVRLCNCFGELEPECEGCKRMREVFKEYEWTQAIKKLRKHRRRRHPKGPSGTSEKQNPAVYIPPYINGE